MRISDWGSDVCSSDLGEAALAVCVRAGRQKAGDRPLAAGAVDVGALQDQRNVGIEGAGRDWQRTGIRGGILLGVVGLEIGRASCRERVCAPCRSRWSPYIYNKQKTVRSRTTHN